MDRVLPRLIILLFPYRYKATLEPIQYWNENVGQNPWKKTFWYYFLPLTCFSVIFNLPKFWEVQLKVVSVITTEDLSKVITSDGSGTRNLEI